MEPAKTIIVVILGLASVNENFGQQVSTLTCDLNKICKTKPTLNITQKEFASHSPFYEPIFVYQKSLREHVTSCNTYFPIDDSTFLIFRTVTRADGSVIVQVYITSDIKGRPGVLREQGLFMGAGNTTTVHNVYLIDTGCGTCDQFYMVYGCFFLDTEDYVHPEDDFVFGASSSTSPPAYCLDRFEQQVDRLGFSHSAGFIRPSAQPSRCVTRFNNNSCINADRVDPAYAISYP